MNKIKLSLVIVMLTLSQVAAGSVPICSGERGHFSSCSNNSSTNCAGLYVAGYQCEASSDCDSTDCTCQNANLCESYTVEDIINKVR